MTDSGLIQVGCLMTTFFRIEFLMSSLKVESHFRKVARRETQYVDFLNNFQTLSAIFLLKMRIIGKDKTKTARIIKAAMQTITSKSISHFP
jgi:hypothetical protein